MNSLRRFFFSKDGIMLLLALVLTGIVIKYNTANIGINFIARLGNFVLVCYIIWRAAGKQLVVFFRNRKAAIVDTFDILAEQREKAARHLQALEVRIASVDAEREAILQESRDQAELMRQAIIAKAHEEALLLKEKALKAAVAEAKTAMNELRATTADAIFEAAQVALHERLDAKTHAKLIKEAVDKVVLQ